MKTKFFTLLTLCLTLSTFTAKAAPAEPQLFFTGVSNAANNYFGGYLCTWTTVTENGNTFGRFTRPSGASLTYGPQWGYVDLVSVPTQQTYPYAIAGGNLTFGTNQAANWEYITVRMRKNTSGSPQINLQSQTQNLSITSATSVVVGEWVSYLFDVTATSGTSYKMLTVIPDKDNAACTADIDDVYATNAPLTVTTTVNDASMGSVSGGGSYPTANSAILTATPKTGYRFVNWTNTATSAEVSTATTYTYALSGGTIGLQANFVAGYTIAATSNDVAKGTVAGAGGFDGSAPISLTASVVSGNRLIGWVENGTLVSTDLVYTFTPASNRTLVAYFGVSSTNYTSTAPAALTYAYGTTGDTGAKGSFAIDYLGTGDVTVTLPSTPSYEISLTDGSGYTNGPITLTANGSSNVPYTTIYVRLKDGLGFAASYANTVNITPTTGSVATISLTGSVSKKTIFLNTTKVRRYNGTTATSGLSGSLIGIVGSDNVTLTGSGTYNTAAVGTFKTVTVGLTGSSSANYSCSIIGHILAKWLNVGISSPSSKVYSATTAATYSGTLTSIPAAEVYAAGTENDGKPYTTETVTLSGSSVTAAAYNNLNVINAYQIVYTGITIGGAQAANYTFAYPSTITPKALTVTTANKEYDGATTATTTLNGKLSADNATVSLNGSLAFANANVGTSKAVSIATPLSLTGTVVGIYATNYSLTQPSGLTANITAKALTITSPIAANKVYDGTATTTISGLTGKVGSDDVALTGTFADANVGTAKSVTASLTGTANGNYSASLPTGLTANITVKPLTLPDAAATSKIYDGTNAAVITGTLTGKVGSEDVSFNGTGTFADANVANGISVSSTSSLTGSASGNYSLTQPTGLTANITSLGLTVSSPSATSKSYDGNANIAVSGTLLTPIGGDDVSLNTTGTVTNANIGTGKTVTVSLSGAKAGNYSLTQPSGLVANITPASANSTGGNISTSGFTVQDLANTNITVTSGELVIDQNSSIHGIAVNSGAKLSLNSGSTLSTGALTLDNNGTGHGTFVDANSNGGLTVTGSTTVNQYLGAARNWYISSPISNATAPSGYTYYKYHEAGDNENLTPLYTTAYWENIGATPSLTTGTGYVANLASGTATYSLTGTLNTGEVPLTLSRSGALLPGFNLVGNPYPSFLDISTLASNSDLVPTYWVRSKNGSYVFDTYNIPGGISTGLSGFEVTSKIAPMQAFWLRVKSGSSSASVVFTNAMRAHQDDTNNKFRITNALKQQVLRLQVSNGISTDETVLYTNSAASNDFDVYDSQKMSSSNISIPEIYTLVDGEHLTINGLNSIPYEVELPLGFTSGQSNTFNFKATQFSNFDAGTRILLKDYADINNPVITDLTDGSSYSFTTDITNNNTNRFTLTFKAPSVATGFNPESNTNVWISAKNGQIVVNGVTNGATLEVFNAVGQKVISRNLTGLSVQPNNLPAGAYMVKVTYGGKSITRKIILD